MATGAGGPGGGLLGMPRVDGGRDGSAQPSTHRDVAYGAPAIPGPEIPAGGKKPDHRGAHLAVRCGVAVTPRVQLAAGRLPAHLDQTPSVLSVLGGPEGSSLFAPARWAWAWSPPSVSGSGGQAPDRRRVRPGSGRLDAGVDIKIVSDRIGHAGIDVSGRIYGHRSNGHDRQAAETMARLIFGEEWERLSTPPR